MIEFATSTRNGWDLATGEMLPNVPNASGNLPVGFVSNQILCSRNNLYTLGEALSIWSFPSSNEIKEIDPSGQLWVAIASHSSANAYLVPIRVPQDEVLDYFTNYQKSSGSMRPGSTDFNYDELMRGSGFVMPSTSVVSSSPSFRPSSGPSVVPPTLYDYDTFASIILADDEKLVRQLKWLPGAKCPTLGERWGMGVIVRGTTTPPSVLTYRDFEGMTGEIGTSFVAELNKRASRGDFGDWSAGNATPLAAAVFITGSDETALLKNARDKDLDCLALFDVRQIQGRTGRVEDAEMAIQFHDLHGRRETWTSAGVRSSRVIAAKNKGDDAVKEYLDVVTKQIDAEYRLTPLPNISADIAAKRMQQLAASSTSMRPAMFAEIRFYHVNKLIDEAAASAVYSDLFGATDGPAFITGKPADRQKMIRQWLSKS